MEVLVIAQTAISVLGVGGLVYWMRKWFKALEGAVNAQKDTIEAQKAHIDSMASFLNMADAPKMAERVEAYKKLAEEERDAIIRAAERKFEEEKKTLSESSAKCEDKLGQLLTEYREQGLLYYQAAAVMAASFNIHPPLWELQKDRLPPKLRSLIDQLMRATPAWFTGALRERMTTPDVGRK